MTLCKPWGAQSGKNNAQQSSGSADTFGHLKEPAVQAVVQERNRGKSDSDGRPDRTLEEIHRWAVEHQLPDADGHVQFLDARIEYEDRDGHIHTLDIEVETRRGREGTRCENS